jgi:ketosteroid isomerase-like protein
VSNEATTTNGVELAKAIYGYFQRGELGRMLEALAPDCEWQEFTIVPSMRGLRRGPQQVAEFFQALGATGQVEHFQPHTYVTQNDKTIVLGDARMKLLQTGQVVEYSWVHVMTFEGSQLTSWRGYLEADKFLGTL